MMTRSILLLALLASLIVSACAVTTNGLDSEDEAKTPRATRLARALVEAETLLKEADRG